MDLLKEFSLCFIPLFVAIDALGVVPLFLSLTEGMTEGSKKSLVTRATLTCLAIAVVFLLTGRLLFDLLGITDHP